MKKFLSFIALLLATISVSASNSPQSNIVQTDTIKMMKLKITVGDKILYADLYDYATAKSFIEKLPLTLPMQDLYEREMVYRFKEELPANETRTSGYEVGDICYWTPRHSFVIFYKQNGEVISNLQKVGRISQGIKLFESTGNVDVKFELAEN